MRILSKLFVCVLLLAMSCLPTLADTNFLAGADFSLLSYFESRGVTYKDNGVVTDGLQILKNHGINCVRLRLFTSSAAQASSSPYNYINNLSYNLPLALRVKNAGLQFLLDFHYSDTWADPGHQLTPAAWFTNNFSQMVQQMRSYNSNVIAAFAAEGAMPDYVQIGNETRQGFLFTNNVGATIGQVSGSYNTAWSQFGQLEKAAIQGIQDATNATGAKVPKIIVHIDTGGNWDTTMWFFDNLNFQNVPYDMIGLSYYPFFQGALTNLVTCLSNTAVRYHKPVVVAETAFPWTNSMKSWTNSLYGYAPTVAGQLAFLADLAKTVKNVPSQLGAGVFYWAAEYQAVIGVNESGYNTTSFFATNGNVLPAADAIGGMAKPLVLQNSKVGSNLELRWPFSGAASSLMSSTNLSAGWVQVTNPVQIQTTGALLKVTVPFTNNSGFYRLQ